MNPDTILNSFKNVFGAKILEERKVERTVGIKAPRSVYDLWITVDRETLHDAVKHLVAEFNPHLSVISGEDIGNDVALNYHFASGWGEHYGEVTFTIRTTVPKNDPKVPTICDILPGAQTAEREKREFYGLEVVGIPDDRNLFLPEDATIHPWRNDLQDEMQPQMKRLVKWEERDA